MGKRRAPPRKAIAYRIEGTCYICTSHCRDTRGYPLISIDGHMKGLHRHIWEQTNDRRIPEKMVVCHTCGNLACINPSHLKLASRADLTRRLRSKLNVEQVLDIRNNQELSCSELAKKYGVTNTNISAIRRGKSWKHIDVRIKDNPYFGYSGIMHSQGKFSKLTKDQVREIRADKTSSQDALASRFGVSQPTICRIKQGRSWKHLTET